MNRIGGTLSTLAASKRWARLAEVMIAAVASTGMAAKYPGNGVDAVYRYPQTSTPTRPV